MGFRDLAVFMMESCLRCARFFTAQLKSYMDLYTNLDKFLERISSIYNVPST